MNSTFVYLFYSQCPLIAAAWRMSENDFLTIPNVFITAALRRTCLPPSGCVWVGGEGAAAVVWTPLTSHLPRSETRSTAAADPGWGEAAATLLECYNHSHFDHLEIDCRFRFLIFNWHSLTGGRHCYILYFSLEKRR